MKKNNIGTVKIIGGFVFVTVLIELLGTMFFFLLLFIIAYLIYTKKIDISKHVKNFGGDNYGTKEGYVGKKGGASIGNEKIKNQGSFTYDYGRKTFVKKVSSESGFDKLKIVGDNQDDYTSNDIETLMESVDKYSDENKDTHFHKHDDLEKNSFEKSRDERENFIQPVKDIKRNDWLNKKNRSTTITESIKELEKKGPDINGETILIPEIKQVLDSGKIKKKTSIFDNNKNSSIFSKSSSSIFGNK